MIWKHWETSFVVNFETHVVNFGPQHCPHEGHCKAGAFYLTKKPSMEKSFWAVETLDVANMES